MFTFLEERTRRLLATLTAVALLAGLSVIGVLAPARAADRPTLNVSKTVGLNPEGEELTITGSGFNTTAPNLHGAPSATAKAGFYVQVGWVAETWRPSEGAPASARSNVASTWVADATNMSAPSKWTDDATGEFEWTVTIDKATAEAKRVDGARLAVFTIGGGGYVGADSEAVQYIDFMTPTETVLSAPKTSTVGSTITLSASVAPAASGTVEFTDGGVSLGRAPVSGGAASLMASGLAEGEHSFRAEFTPADVTSYTTSTSPAVAHVVTAAAPVWTPQITVYAADGVTPLGDTQVALGDTIVVKGTGFDPLGNPATGLQPPIAAGSPAGTYVVFGKFADDWRPSAGAASSSRVVGSQKWAMSDAAFGLVDTKYQGAIRGQRAVVGTDGAFETTLTIQKKVTSGAEVDWPATGNFGVYTYAANTAVNPAQELKVAVNLEGSVPPVAATATTTVISAAPASVVAGGSSSLIATVTPASAAGTVEFYSGQTLIGSAPVAQGVANLSTGALAAGEHAFTARFVPADSALYTASATATGVTVTAKAAVDGGTVTPPASAAGQLVWGVKASFTSYITGSGAAGTVSVSGGAAVSGSSFTFSQATKDFNGSTGTVGYAGAVRFTGHHGALDLKLSNPKIKVTGPGSGVLIVDVVGKGLTGGSVDKGGVEFATLNLAAPTTVNGATTWSNAAATLTAAGSEAFSGFYPAGTALDPVSFTVGADKAPGETPAETPPAAVAPLAPGTYPNATASVATILPGGEVTVTGTGFGANTTGIELAVYSVRQVLATGLTADANGSVTATVKLPANLAAGVHTLSFEAPNGVKSQITITVEAPAVAAKQCVANAVSGASLSWGVKSAFRTYITGPIAGGSVSANGVTDTGSTFRWTGGTGKFNTEANQGRVAFGGSVNFSGHGGILDLTLSNVRIQVTSASTGMLIADVSSTDMAGTKSSQTGVTVASLSLAGKKSTSGGTVTWTNASASLTAAGAKAFAGSYVAGEALDPVTFSFPLGATVECDSTSGALASTGADGLGDAALLALAAMTFGLSLVMVARRRRTMVRIG